MRRSAYLSLPAFFGLKVVAGLLLLKLSAAFLPVAGFSVFSQFMLFAALLNMLAIGGAQNGLIRQIAASASAAERARVRNAALIIWGGALAGLGLASILFARPIAIVLAGEAAPAWLVPAIALTALLAGPAQIFCSMLTGMGRVAASLIAQATGLMAGTIGAAVVLAHRAPAGAVLAFSAGPLLTLAVAGLMVRGHKLPAGGFRAIWPEVRTLLAYSAAFAALAVLNAAIPFTLRYIYREAFSAEQLGYWMAANRVSDTTTQLMALYLGQIFMPHYAKTFQGEAGAVLRQGWIVGTGIMASFLIVFLAGSRLMVTLFLSDKFQPAVPMIAGYMTGDVFRATVSVAMYASFARARLTRYVGLEAGALCLFGALMIGLIHAGRPDAPMIAYPIAYLLCAVAIGAVHILRRGGPDRGAKGGQEAAAADILAQ